MFAPESAITAQRAMITGFLIPLKSVIKIKSMAPNAVGISSVMDLFPFF